MEVCYLLLYGELPSRRQLDGFIASILHHTMINESLRRFFNGFHHNAHPMAMTSAVVASLSAFYYDSMDIHNPRDRDVFAHRIIAKKLAAHVLCRAQRALQHRPGCDPRARVVVHSARRP
jgi:citrate synthase